MVTDVSMVVTADTVPGIVEQLSVARCTDLARVHGVPIGRGRGPELRPRLIDARVPLCITIKVPG